jgi:hypothetical protein
MNVQSYLLNRLTDHVVCQAYRHFMDGADCPCSASAMHAAIKLAIVQMTEADAAQAAYHDPSMPRRECDYCRLPYNGPAIYCSLSCAVADAP